MRPFIDWMEGVLAGGNFIPEVVNRAQFVDEKSNPNFVFLLYWKSRNDFQNWFDQKQVASWWNDKARTRGPMGIWREVIAVQRDRLETLFSSENAEGVAEMGSGFELVREHAYWGGMRDRMPISGRDDLEAGRESELTTHAISKTKGRRIRMAAPKNMSVIRSGQFWGDCGDAELEYYQSKVHPTLKKGMDYLATNGVEANCYACRLMDQLGPDGEKRDQTFGLAFFKSLSDLESWSEHHPTHLKIFHAFLAMVEEFQGELDIQLWHEVYTVAEGCSEFEYVNCHNRTGLLTHSPSQFVKKDSFLQKLRR